MNNKLSKSVTTLEALAIVVGMIIGSGLFLMQSIIAAIYIFSGSFNMLTDILVFVIWIFFTMGVCGVFILRKKFPELMGSYKVPFYPITPIVGAVGSVYILISTALSTPRNVIIGLAITAVGIPVYYYLTKKK